MSLWARVAEQFGRPTGILGNIAGAIMASRASNIERNAWAVSLLELEPTDHVLEVGFGPGVAIQRMAETLTTGVVWGVDHSVVMVQQASRRNRLAIAQGRVKLFLASVADAPEFSAPLDKVLDINSLQFWADPVADLKRLRDRLRAGGKIFLVHQPGAPGATGPHADEAAQRYSRYLEQAGFRDTATIRRPMKPVPAVCVVGSR